MTCSTKLRFRFGKRAPMLLCSSVLENNLLLAVDLANPDMPSGNARVAHGTIHVERRALLEGNTYIERISIRNYGSSTVRFPPSTMVRRFFWLPPQPSSP